MSSYHKNLKTIKDKINDPAHFSDDYPFLMFPVRLETRFMRYPITDAPVALEPSEEDLLTAVKTLEDKVSEVVDYTSGSNTGKWWESHNLSTYWTDLFNAFLNIGELSPAVYNKIKLKNGKLLAQLEAALKNMKRGNRELREEIAIAKDGLENLEKLIEELKFKCPGDEEEEEPNMESLFDCIKFLTRIPINCFPFDSPEAVHAFLTKRRDGLYATLQRIRDWTTANNQDVIAVSDALTAVNNEATLFRADLLSYADMRLTEEVDPAQTTDQLSSLEVYNKALTLKGNISDAIAMPDQDFVAVSYEPERQSLNEELADILKALRDCFTVKITENDRTGVIDKLIEVNEEWRQMQEKEKNYYEDLVGNLAPQESVSVEVNNIIDQVNCHPHLGTAVDAFPFDVPQAANAYKEQFDQAAKGIHDGLDALTTSNSAEVSLMDPALQGMADDSVALWQEENSFFKTKLSSLVVGSGPTKISSGWQAHTDLTALKSQMQSVNGQAYSVHANIIAVKADLNSRMADVAAGINDCTGNIRSSDNTTMAGLLDDVVTEWTTLMQAEKDHVVAEMNSKITPATPPASQTNPIHTDIISDPDLTATTYGFPFTNMTQMSNYRNGNATNLDLIHQDIAAVTFCTAAEHTEIDGDLDLVANMEIDFRTNEFNFYDQMMASMMMPEAPFMGPGWSAFANLDALVMDISNMNVQPYASLSNVVSLKQGWTSQMSTILTDIQYSSGINPSDYGMLVGRWGDLRNEWQTFTTNEKTHYANLLAGEIGVWSPPPSTASASVVALEQAVQDEPYFTSSFTSFPYFSHQTVEAFRNSNDADLNAVHQSIDALSTANNADLAALSSSLDSVSATGQSWRATEATAAATKLSSMTGGSSKLPGWSPYTKLNAVKSTLDSLNGQSYSTWGNVVTTKQDLSDKMARVHKELNSYSGSISSSDRNSMNSTWAAVNNAWDTLEAIEKNHYNSEVTTLVNNSQSVWTVSPHVEAELESLERYDVMTRTPCWPWQITAVTKAYRLERNEVVYDAGLSVETETTFNTGDYALIQSDYDMLNATDQSIANLEKTYFTDALNNKVNGQGSSQVAAGWSVYNAFETTRNFIQTQLSQPQESAADFRLANDAIALQLETAQQALLEYDGDLLQTDADQTTTLFEEIDLENGKFREMERDYVVDETGCKIPIKEYIDPISTAAYDIYNPLAASDETFHAPTDFDFSNPLNAKNRRTIRHNVIDDAFADLDALTTVNDAEAVKLNIGFRRAETSAFDFQHNEWQSYLNQLETLVVDGETSVAGIGTAIYDELQALISDVDSKNGLSTSARINNAKSYKNGFASKAQTAQEAINSFNTPIGHNEFNILSNNIQQAVRGWQKFEAFETKHHLDNLASKVSTSETTLPADNVSSEILAPFDSAISKLSARAANNSDLTNTLADKTAAYEDIEEAFHALYDYKTIDSSQQSAIQSRVNETLEWSVELNHAEWDTQMNSLMAKANGTVDLQNDHSIDYKPTLDKLASKLEKYSKSGFDPLEVGKVMRVGLANDVKEVFEMLDSAPAVNQTDVSYISKMADKIKHYHQDLLYRDLTHIGKQGGKKSGPEKEPPRPKNVDAAFSTIEQLRAAIAEANGQELTLEDLPSVLSNLGMLANTLKKYLESIKEISPCDCKKLLKAIAELKAEYAQLKITAQDLIDEAETAQEEFQLKLEEFETKYFEFLDRDTELIERPWSAGDIPEDTQVEVVGEATAQAYAYQLWVRVYPDDIAIDTHEPQITEDEKADAMAFWNEIFRDLDPQTDAGVNVIEKAQNAWKRLVDQHGTGRAAYISQLLKPSNYNHYIYVSADTPDFPTVTAVPNDPNGPLLGWTRPAHSLVMPDEFVFVLYYGERVEKRVGRAVDSGNGSLVLGFDPSLFGPNAPHTHFNQDPATGDLTDIPPQMHWLTDFNAAVECGMGYRFTISQDQYEHGFDKLFVMGVRSEGSENPDQRADTNQSKLEQLIEGHHYGNDGISVLKQGTPTNNTESGEAANGQKEQNWEDSFKNYMGPNLFTRTADVPEMRDGQWLATALGVADEVLQHIPNADGYDVRDGIMMNRALWPATIGSFADSFLKDILLKGDLKNLENLRSYFSEHVTGRGKIPAIRVGDQPYGIMPVTLFTDADWDNEDIPGHSKEFFNSMMSLVKALEDDLWDDLRSKVNYLHKGLDASEDPKKITENQEKLAELMGLHASSVEFRVRQSVSNGEVPNGLKEQIANLYDGVSGEGKPYPELVKKLTKGQDISHESPLFQNIMAGITEPMKGNTIDHLRSQDTQLVDENRGLPLKFGGKNYIDWLATASESEIDAEHKDMEDKDKSLLYLLLRQSILKEYERTAAAILDKLKQLEDEALRNAGKLERIPDNSANNQYDRVKITYDFDPEDEIEEGGYIRITDAINAENNGVFAVLKVEVIEDEKFVYIQNEQAIDELSTTGKLAKTPDKGYGTSMRRNLGSISDTSFDSFNITADQSVLRATSLLGTSVPNITALSSNMTLSKYLDDKLNDGYYTIEKQHLVELREAIAKLADRSTAELERAFAEHIDLCSYRLDAWKLGVANFRLDQRRKKAGKETGIYLGAFGWLENGKRNISLSVKDTQGLNPVFQGELLYEDGQNEGYIHAPSYDHAVTAAILKSGYTANAKNGTDDEKNQMAINLSSNRVRRATFILEGVRNGQPLGAMLGYQFERNVKDHSNQALQSLLPGIRAEYPLENQTEQNGDVNSDEAIARLQQAHVVNGYTLLTAYRESAVAYGSEIMEIIEQLADTMDAVNDLTIAESVHQAAKGNPVGAKAMMGGGHNSTMPQIPDVISTPRSGRRVHHKAVYLFDPTQASGSTPRASGEPVINAYLANIMGGLSSWGVNATYETDEQSTGTMDLLLSELSTAHLEHADLLYMLTDDPETTPCMLEEWIAHKVRELVNQTFPNSSEVRVTVNWFVPAAAPKSLGQAIPMLNNFRAMLVGSSPANALDFDHPEQNSSPTSGSTDPRGWNLSALQARVQAIKGSVDSFAGGSSSLANNAAGQDQLKQAAAFGIAGLLNSNAWSESATDLQLLSNELDRAQNILSKRSSDAQEILSEIDLNGNNQKSLEQLTEAVRILLGHEFTPLPFFTLSSTTEPALGDSPQNIVNFATVNSQNMLSANFLDPLEFHETPVDDWMSEIGMVRPQVANLEMHRIMAEMISQNSPTPLCPIQLPYRPGEPWLALEYPLLPEDMGDPNSILIANKPSGFPTTNLCGLVVDEWSEVIPEDQVSTALAINFDQPDARAPQSCLLMVGPRSDGRWSWDDMLQIMEETFKLAKDRAIEPKHFYETGLDQLLPTVWGEVTSVDGRNVSFLTTTQAQED